MAHLEHIDSKKWRITVELGRDPKTGRRKRKYKTVKEQRKKHKKSC